MRAEARTVWPYDSSRPPSGLLAINGPQLLYARLPSIPFEEIDIVSLRKQQVHLLRRGFKYIDFWLDL